MCCSVPQATNRAMVSTFGLRVYALSHSRRADKIGEQQPIAGALLSSVRSDELRTGYNTAINTETSHSSSTVNCVSSPRLWYRLTVTQ